MTAGQETYQVCSPMHGDRTGVIFKDFLELFLVSEATRLHSLTDITRPWHITRFYRIDHSRCHGGGENEGRFFSPSTVRRVDSAEKSGRWLCPALESVTRSQYGLRWTSWQLHNSRRIFPSVHWHYWFGDREEGPSGL